MNCNGPYNGAWNLGTDVTLAMVGEVDGCMAECYANPICEAITITLEVVAYECGDRLGIHCNYMCGLRSRIDMDKCIMDGHHSTYYLASPLRAPRLPSRVHSPQYLERGKTVYQNR